MEAFALKPGEQWKRNLYFNLLTAFSDQMNQQTKQTAFDLTLVFVVALLPQLLQSVYFFFHGANLFHDSTTIYLECLYLLPSFIVVLYVLRVKQHTFADIGVTEDPYDLFYGVVLAVSCMIVYSLFWAIVNQVWQKPLLSPATASFFKEASFPGLMLYAILSAAREELVIRGFVMRSVFLLTTGNRVITVLSATCLDFLLFLSYGALPALGFTAGHLVLSLYFMRTGKLMPVVLAHIVLNMVFIAQL